MDGRPRLDRAQIEQYYDCIAIRNDERLYSLSDLSESRKLEYLALLTKHNLVKIPFENLSLHYSWHRTINVRPTHLFSKIISSERRGGYCHEVNSLFHTLLLSLGFDAFMAGSRVYDQRSQRYGGFSHCVNIIKIGNIHYLVDVGFGGANGPTKPTPLKDGPVYGNIAPSQIRLVHGPIPQQVNQDNKVWIYQHRINSSSDWIPMYCFVDFEFTLEDIRVMNFSPWKSPSSFFTYKILVCRFTTQLESDGDCGPGTADEAAVSGGEIDGALILDHEKLKWRRNGKTVLTKQLSNDEERVLFLRKYFGITLTEEDRAAIFGTMSELHE